MDGEEVEDQEDRDEDDDDDEEMQVHPISSVLESFREE